MGYIQENIGIALIKADQGGYEQKAPPSAFVFTGKAFEGVFNLSTPFGTFWNDLAQAGAITLSASPFATVGGVDRVKITANGSSITVPSTFTNVGTDSITTTNGTVNIIYVVKTNTNSYDYSVKIV